MTDARINVDDFEEAARARLDPGAYAYFAGGAGDERTLRANAAAFERWELRPRVLVDVDEVSTATTVLGTEVSMPLLVAPTAFQRLADPEGELATARAAAAAGTVMSSRRSRASRPRSSPPPRPGAPQWFQLYWSRDRGFTEELVAAVVEAGFRALLLTVDFPVAGRRERDIREPRSRSRDDLPSPNLPFDARREDFHAALGSVVDATLTWRDLEWLRSRCPLPLVVKGILTAEDALLAAEHGAEGVVVSNHGGRQLDGVPATLDVLPEVVEAVGERIEVLFDGGVRRGHRRRSRRSRSARGRSLRGGPCSGGSLPAGEAGATQVLALLRTRSRSGLKLLGAPAAGGRDARARSAGRPVRMIPAVEHEGTATTTDGRTLAFFERGARRRRPGDRLPRHARAAGSRAIPTRRCTSGTACGWSPTTGPATAARTRIPAGRSPTPPPTSRRSPTSSASSASPSSAVPAAPRTRSPAARCSATASCASARSSRLRPRTPTSTSSTASPSST